MNDPDKTYALLICRTLKTVCFRFDEDRQIAIAALRKRAALYVPLKWNARIQSYVPQEVVE